MATWRLVWGWHRNVIGRTRTGFPPFDEKLIDQTNRATADYEYDYVLRKKAEENEKKRGVEENMGGAPIHCFLLKGSLSSARSNLLK